MKTWERVVEAKLKRDYTIGEQQCGFILLKSSIDALRLMENYRRTCTVFMDLEKTRDGVQREKKLQYCMRKLVLAQVCGAGHLR